MEYNAIIYKRVRKEWGCGSLNQKIGPVLYRIRMQKGIRQEYLCRGLCACSTMSRYESGDRVPDRLLFNTFLQRLGKSADKFATMISLNEYYYLKWKRKLLTAVRDHNWDEVERLLEEKEASDRSCNEILQKQFYLYVHGLVEYEKKKEIGECLRCLREAIEMTMPGFPDILDTDVLLSTEEVRILVVYADKKAESGDQKEGVRLLWKILDYIGRHYTDEQERLKVYPGTVCVLIRYLKEDSEREKRIRLCRTALELLTINKSLKNLPEILSCLVKDLKAEGCQDAVRYEKQLNALLSLYSEYGRDPLLEYWIADDTQQEVYLIDEVIYTSRIEKELSQESLCEGICAVETISRIENGKNMPNPRNYEALAEKLGIRLGIFTGELATDDYEVLELKWYLNRASANGDLEDMKYWLDRLKAGLNRNVPENLQYLEMMEASLLYRTGKISAEEFLERDKKALHYTAPVDETAFWNHIFSRVECEIVNHVAVVLGIMGKPETAVLLLEKLYESYRRSKVGEEFHWVPIHLTRRNLCFLLSNVNRNIEAINLADEQIDSDLKNGKGDLAGELMDKAYALEQDKKENREKCKIYFLQAYYLSDLMLINTKKEAVRKYYEKNYEKITD